jgi:hypothetical protein
MTIGERIKAVAEVLWEIVWRGFGLFLFILGSAAGVGSLVTGDPITGIVIAWGTLMLGVIGAVGYAIAITGKASKTTVAKSVQDAVQKFEEKNDK